MTLPHPGTPPFKSSRGYRAVRCPTCTLPVHACICAFTPTLSPALRFWILMHAAEYPKPTNTARLIQAALPQTHIFLWQGSTPPPELATLLGDRRFTPYMVFPHGQSGLFERLRERPWRPETMPAFLILDGTWKQTRKMFLRSPYLRGLPWVTIIPEAPSAYALRQQRCATHLSTVEVAIALLQQVGDSPDSRRLAAYFQRFTAYSWAVRYGRPLPTLLPAAPFA